MRHKMAQLISFSAGPVSTKVVRSMTDKNDENDETQ